MPDDPIETLETQIAEQEVIDRSDDEPAVKVDRRDEARRAADSALDADNDGPNPS